jgi:hypothetical protein
MQIERRDLARIAAARHVRAEPGDVEPRERRRVVPIEDCEQVLGRRTRRAPSRSLLGEIALRKSGGKFLR